MDKHYGVYEVLGSTPVRRDGKNKYYLVRCARCGRTHERSMRALTSNTNTGCDGCRNYFHFDGKLRTLDEISELTGVSRATLAHRRTKLNLSLEEAAVYVSKERTWWCGECKRFVPWEFFPIAVDLQTRKPKRSNTCVSCMSQDGLQCAKHVEPPTEGLPRRLVGGCGAVISVYDRYFLEVGPSCSACVKADAERVVASRKAARLEELRSYGEYVGVVAHHGMILPLNGNTGNRHDGTHLTVAEYYSVRLRNDEYYSPRGSSRKYHVFGMKMSLSQAAACAGISWEVLWKRLNAWGDRVSIEEAMLMEDDTPVHLCSIRQCRYMAPAFRFPQVCLVATLDGHYVHVGTRRVLFCPECMEQRTRACRGCDRPLSLDRFYFDEWYCDSCVKVVRSEDADGHTQQA